MFPDILVAGALGELGKALYLRKFLAVGVHAPERLRVINNGVERLKVGRKGCVFGVGHKHKHTLNTGELRRDCVVNVISVELAVKCAERAYNRLIADSVGRRVGKAELVGLAEALVVGAVFISAYNLGPNPAVIVSLLAFLGGVAAENNIAEHIRDCRVNFAVISGHIPERAARGRGYKGIHTVVALNLNGVAVFVGLD